MFYRKKSKYGAVRTNGMSSKLEASVYRILMERQTIGLIKDLKCQVPVVLVQPKRNRGLRWKIDFSYTVVATGKTEYAEAKGFADATYLIKLRLFKNDPPGALEIWKGNYRNPIMVERIEKGET